MKDTPNKKEFTFGNLTMKQWLTWSVTTVAAALTMSAYAHSNFASRVVQQEFRQIIEKRLDRIESKLDRIIFQKK